MTTVGCCAEAKSGVHGAGFLLLTYILNSHTEVLAVILSWQEYLSYTY
jgi:hypothetical protein